MQQTDSGDRHLRKVVSFTARGSRLDARRQRVWDEHADRFVVDVPRGEATTEVHPDFRLDLAGVFGREAPLVVEIGSGKGEAVVHAAETHPDVDHLAVEVYQPGVAQTVLLAARREVPNVRLIRADAVGVLQNALAPGSVDELWTFFPDPWHKKKHQKRRLVSPQFAQIAARALRPGARWRLASDWAHYSAQMRDVLDAAPGFTRGFDGDWAPRFEGRPETGFEAKAARAGREVHDLVYVRD
ncbi:tRNA (guanosine(46)-N7)-methyltransferase TrmB [Solicola sp. PLA-1-18]|uniref:tRNA (guanosine(46)-N7)-methyltransferase TrmB n=1 Tax=Solicola sp. PLA-1-18 TaxID=3380532 RepID=UPI003B76013E